MRDKKTLLGGMPWRRHGDCQSIWRSHGWVPPSEIKRRELEEQYARVRDALGHEPTAEVLSIFSTIRKQKP